MFNKIIVLHILKVNLLFLTQQAGTKYHFSANLQT